MAEETAPLIGKDNSNANTPPTFEHTINALQKCVPLFPLRFVSAWACFGPPHSPLLPRRPHTDQQQPAKLHTQPVQLHTCQHSPTHTASTAPTQPARAENASHRSLCSNSVSCDAQRFGHVMEARLGRSHPKESAQLAQNDAHGPLRMPLVLWQLLDVDPRAPGRPAPDDERRHCGCHGWYVVLVCACL